MMIIMNKIRQDYARKRRASLTDLQALLVIVLLLIAIVLLLIALRQQGRCGGDKLGIGADGGYVWFVSSGLNYLPESIQQALNSGGSA